MKGLPEHIKDVDSFYKTKSEDDFMPELPENLWDEIVLQIPSSPLPTSSTPTSSYSAKKGGAGIKGINFYHGALFYAAGLLSAIIAYSTYIHLTHQEDTASVHVTLPSIGQTKSLDSASATLRTEEESLKKNETIDQRQSGQDETKSSNSGLSKKEKEFPNLKEGMNEEVPKPNTIEMPSGPGHPLTSHGSDQEVKLEPTENKTSISTTVQEEHTDFYQKHSKKAKDSLAKQLFIPKK